MSGRTFTEEVEADSLDEAIEKVEQSFQNNYGRIEAESIEATSAFNCSQSEVLKGMRNLIDGD
jgi:myo-inositol-1-phosphate synthase